MKCLRCGMVMPPEYIERAKRDRALLTCPTPGCFTVVADYREGKAKEKEAGS